MAQARQGEWVALARYDGADDDQPGLAGYVAQRLRELDVHLQQRFLHMQDVGGVVFQQPGAMPQQRAQRYQVRFGTNERSSSP